MSKMADVSAKHPQYRKNAPKWVKIRDVLAGEDQLKSKGIVYLPLENTEKDQTTFQKRYAVYLRKAILYNATARTLGGVVGQVFSKPPTMEFPDSVKYLQDDPAGAGISLEQQAKAVLRDVMSCGRHGLWVDYPDVPSASLADVATGEVRPVILNYAPEDIINWRTRVRNARTVLSLVVLREDYLENDDGFTADVRSQYRVLRLTEDDTYTVEVWREGKPSSTPKVIKGRDGKPLTEIPFVFVGIGNNDANVDDAPIYDLVIINLAHYRNTADFEEAVFMVGQPTPVWIGVTDAWVRDTWKGEVRLGSRGGIALPTGGSAQLLQVNSNTMVGEALKQKEDQMIALGARLVQSADVTRTATEVKADKVSEVSILASAARNTSAAYAKAFEFCRLFAEIPEEVTFELSTDFDLARMTSQELLALFTIWQGKLISTRDAYDVLRRAGLAQSSFEDAVQDGVSKEAPDPKDPKEAGTGEVQADKRTQTDPAA